MFADHCKFAARNPEKSGTSLKRRYTQICWLLELTLSWPAFVRFYLQDRQQLGWPPVVL